MNEDNETEGVRHARNLLQQLAEVSDLTGRPTPPSPPSSPPPAAEPVEMFVPYYPDARSWVTHHYTVMYVRRLKSGQRWCAHWHEHPEAVMRFEALWRTWEQARLTDLIGTSLWLRTELDHHMPILHADDGPFAGCVDGEHRLPSPAMYPVVDDDSEPMPAPAHR